MVNGWIRELSSLPLIEAFAMNRQTHPGDLDRILKELMKILN